MKKLLTCIFAILMVMGVVNVNAQERISLQEVGFYAWDGWDGSAVKTGDAPCEWGVGVSTGSVYGDMSVKNFADLTPYSKLILIVTEGSPRFLINRLKDEGQSADTFEESYLIDIPNKAWCTSRYQSVNGNVYTIDLKAIAKDYGFVHLHSIKGANWANVTVESAELETAASAKPVGWTELLTNGGLEGEEVSCFVVKEAPSMDILPAKIVDGVGVDGTRGIMVTSPAGASNDWDTQFWITLPESLSAGTRYRIAFDYKASEFVTVSTQSHGEPGSYIHYEMIGNPTFTTEWQTYLYENEITAEQAGVDENLMRSIAFNLAVDKANDVEFYFDNFSFEVYKYGVSAEFAYDVIQLDFGFDTNLPSLVKACGKPRLMYPDDCVSVKANGEELELLSVEGFADGRFYIFLEESLNDDDVVEVTFNNPADAAYHLTYDGGPGGDVKNFLGVAVNNSDVAAAYDAYSYLFVTPTLMASDPENGAFNLSNSIFEFNLTFDKNVDCAALVAELGSEKLIVEPATGYAEKITLKRPNVNPLLSGEYALHITNILPEIDIWGGELFGDTTLVFNIGKLNIDPNDTIRQMIPDYFNATNQGGIPEGWYIVYDGAVREPGTSHGSGANMKEFAAGGDFTRGFYTRTNNSTPDQCIIEYGSLDGYELTLEAGKKYKVTYNLMSWKSTTYTRLEIFDPKDDVVYTQIDENKGSLSGATGVVATGSNFVECIFYPEVTGNYRLRWTPTDANGELVQGMTEIIFANPMVTYIPDIPGIVEGQALLASLNAAKEVLKVAQTDSRYAGVALNTLAAAVAKYEAEYGGYTNPSDYTDAVLALDAAKVAMRDYMELSDTYYTLVGQAEKILFANAHKKFANTELYAELEILVDKYVGKTITGAALQAAIAELQGPVAEAPKLFTQGVSAVSTTGIAALVERIRLGAESLKKLGVKAGDELIVSANNALSDDDALAAEIQNRLKKEIYGQLRNANNSLFEEKLDTNTLEVYTESYDMTVFMKNPNVYRMEDVTDFYEWAVPGWTVPEGYPTPLITYGWTDPGYHISDCMFQTWATGYGIEQTIVGLPVGVYTVVGSFGERNDEASAEGSFLYAKTSDTPDGGYAATVDAPLIGQSFPVDNLYMENIVVTDGTLTIGAVGGPRSHTFFNQVKVMMTGALPYFDYNAAYDELTGDVPGSTPSDPEYNTANVLNVQNTEVFTGSAFSFPVSMTNENSISAFQCDVYLSAGLMLNLNDEGEYDVTLNATRKTSTHSLATSMQPDGAIRVIAYSSSNKLFRGNAGELFSLNLTALEGASENQTVEIRNIRLSTADEQEYLPAPVSAAVTVKFYIPGDANGDGQITIVDVVTVVNALMGTTTSDFVFDAADMDQNGEITIVDVVSVVNVLLGKNVQATGARSILRSNLHVTDAEVNAGESTTLYVKLDNAQAYTAMQMDMNLPEGLTIEGVEMVGDASHTVTYNEEGRIAAYSLGNSRFHGGEALMAITVKADDSFTGAANVGFTNVRVVSTDVVETVLADALSTVIGGAKSIDGVEADENVQILYYSTTGAVSDALHKGLNIIKRIYEDGRVEVSKEMNK